ncbi:GerAB/ArcD/ProY family transporter [Oceanobacillus sp. CAU 1775]
MKVKTRISQPELFFIIVQTIVGLGILSLPFHVFRISAQDGWISVLLTGLSIPFFILLIWFLCKRFPHLTVFDFSKLIVGKILGSIINFLYITHLLIIVSYIFVNINDIFIRWIFPDTPGSIFLAIGILILIYGCIGKIKNMVYLFSFLFVFVLFLFFITLFTFFDPYFDFRYLFPVGANGFRTILHGSINAMPAFTGFETLLIYFAFVKQPQKLSSTKGSIIAVLFITLLYTYVTFISTMMFSPHEFPLVLEPVLFMLRAIDIHVIQRLDLVFLMIWGIVIATSIISYGYVGSIGISKLFHVKHKLAVFLSGIAVFCLSIVCHNYLEIHDFRGWIQLLTIIFGLIIPSILLLIAIIFKRKA